MKQLIRKVCKIKKIQAPGELDSSFEITGNDSKEDRKPKALRQMRRTSKVVCLPFVN